MIKDKIVAAYETMAEKYNELIDVKPHNAFYDRPNTLQLLPDVKGKNILDAACGPGKYAEILIERGAAVTGFDISPKMVDLAIQRNHGKGVFLCMTCPYRNLAKLKNTSFKKSPEMSELFISVPGIGIEPIHSCERQILSLLRLPIPPPGLRGCNITH
jgi:SAM-dependent methyltransferase